MALCWFLVFVQGELAVVRACCMLVVDFECVFG